MKKYVLMMLMLLCSCKIQKDFNKTEEVKLQEITSAKVIEYDTTRYLIKDTIYQPIKKITYINQEKNNSSTLKEEEKESTKSESSNYLIAFGVGAGLTILTILILKLIIFYFKYKKFH